MTEQSFDHERLDVYRLSIDYVARSFEAAQPLEGLHRHAMLTSITSTAALSTSTMSAPKNCQMLAINGFALHNRSR
ncbi:MAG: hypothetical protein JNM43_20950 [Planctomycetaceae bacterium]|nr:hypothetical protein [Planctomycetaceae bacterium]